MNTTATAKESDVDLRAQEHEITKRQALEWFDWMDDTLNVHRRDFVLREPTPIELERHKGALRLAIEHCHLIERWIARPEFDELKSRLELRIRLLEDAYNTLFDRKLSDEQAEQMLRENFPG